MSQEQDTSNNNSSSATNNNQHQPHHNNKNRMWTNWNSTALGMATHALTLTAQEWSLTGQDSIPASKKAASITNNNTFHNECCVTKINVRGVLPDDSVTHPTIAQLGMQKGTMDIAERMVALLLIRIVALVTHRLENNDQASDDDNDDGNNNNNNSNDDDEKCGDDRNPNGKDETTTTTNKLGNNKSNNNKHNNKNNNKKKKKNTKRKKMYSDYSTTTITKSALKHASDINTKINNSIKEAIARAMVATPDGDGGFDFSSTDNLAMKEMKLTRHSSEPNPGGGGGVDLNNSCESIGNDDDYANKLNNSNSRPTANCNNKDNNNNNNSNSNNSTTTAPQHPQWPTIITQQVISQLRQYILVICENYRNVPYHNVEHAYHVFLSANKLLDLLLHEPPSPNSDLVSNLRIAGPTFGIKSDPLLQLAFLFSALVHDVDHQGISNRQLVMESDDLAILYNDQSVAEQRSLAVAFAMLKQPQYDQLRNVIFDTKEEHFKFRKLVIDLVLVTDIASPERTQIVKSKWKEAFGDVVHDRHNSHHQDKKKKNNNNNDDDGGGGNDDANNSKKKDKKGNGNLRPWRGRPRGGSVGRNKKVLGEEMKLSSVDEATPQAAAATTDPTTTNTVRIPKFLQNKNNYNPKSSSSQKQQQQQPPPPPPQQQQQQQQLPADFRSFCNSMQSTDGGDSLSDSIDFSSSSSSFVSDLEDDFDASAVSRQKMNFDEDDNGLLMNGSMDSKSFSIDVVTNNTSATNSGGSENNGMGDNVVVSTTASSTTNSDINNINNNSLDDSNNVAKIAPSRSDGDLPKMVHDHKKAAQSPRPICRKPNTPSNNVKDSAEAFKPSTLNVHTLNRRKSTDEPARSKLRAPPVRRWLSQSMISTSEIKRHSRAHSEERRLGVRRALDLAGSTIEAFTSSNRSGNSTDMDFLLEDDPDEVDELKATVVLEQMMRAADVAALLQDWGNIMKWSTRLYKELKNGYLHERGEDPSVGWFDNQIKFFDFYILPLAKNLGLTGVFEEEVADVFVGCVKSSLERWIEEGERETELMMKHDEEERQREREELEQKQRDEDWEPAEHKPQRRMSRDILGSDLASSMQSLKLGELNQLASSVNTTTLQNSGDLGPNIALAALSQDSTDHHEGRDNQVERGALTASFNSNASSTTNATNTSPHTTNQESSKNSGSSRFSSRKVHRSRSLETGEERACVMCGTAGRFNCPVCASPYCSVKCCRDHKATSCKLP